QLADAREILFEFFAVCRPECIFQSFGLIVDGVKNASSVSQPPGLSLHFVGTSLQKQLGKDTGRPGVGRYRRTALGPGKARAFACESQARKARLAEEMVGRKRTQRNAVLKASPPLWTRSRCQKAL